MVKKILQCVTQYHKILKGNKKVVHCRHYIDSKRNIQGIGTVYHLNGKKAEMGKYKDNVKVGPWSTWASSGTLLNVTYYSEESPNESKCSIDYYKDGTPRHISCKSNIKFIR